MMAPLPSRSSPSSAPPADNDGDDDDGDNDDLYDCCDINNMGFILEG